MGLAGWFVIIVTLITLACDLWLYVKSRETITQVIVIWSKDYPALPFALGFLMGHFFG